MHPTFGEEDHIHGVEAAKPATPKAKAENFFYHYKWYVIFAAFLAVAVIVCTLQMCNKQTYDAYVMFAGPKGLLSVQTAAIEKTLSDMTEDYDQNGSVDVNFSALYIEDVEKLRDSDRKDAGTLAAKSRTNYDTFMSEIQVGNYLVCFLSPDLFYDLDNDTGIFVPIYDDDPSDGNAYGVFAAYTEIADKIPDSAVVGKNKSGVRLSALPLYTFPGFSALPADTILCIRQPSAVAEWYQSILSGDSDSAVRYRQHEELFRRLLLAEPEETE